MSVPWVQRPAFDIDLALSVRQRYQRMPDELIDPGLALLRGVMAEFPMGSAALADLVRLRTGNRFGAEIDAISRRVGVNWRQVMLANVSYDLALALIGCSTCALATADGPVLARNMDWWPEGLLARATFAFRYVDAGGLCFAAAGFPGAVGVVTGMSGRGFAVALNAALAPEGSDKLGYPVLLHLRRVVEDASDFDAAVTALSHTRLATPALLTVVGTRNDQRVVIERGPRRHAQRWAQGEEPLVATNHFRMLDGGDDTGDGDGGADWRLRDTTCARYEAVMRFARSMGPDRSVDDTALLYMLSDPSVIQGITAQHIILRPIRGAMSVYVPRRLVEAAV